MRKAKKIIKDFNGDTHKTVLFYHIKQRTGIRWTIYIRNIVKKRILKL